MSCDGNQQACSSNSNSNNYWLKIPRDITAMILQKLGFLQILLSAQLVCTEWHQICTDPSIWTTISVVDISPVNWLSYLNLGLAPNFDDYKKHVENMIKLAVDRSCGTLFDLDLDQTFMSEELLNYVVERCTRIRRLRVEPLHFDVLERVAPRLPLLEDLQLVGIGGVLSLEAIETLVRCCPRLRSLKSYVHYDAVEALLDGCPHLESLDLNIQLPYTFKTTGTLQMKKKKKSPLTGDNDDPCTWSTICVINLWDTNTLRLDSNLNEFKHVIQRAVDKSCGGLVDVDLGIYIMSEDILSYIVERCTRIRRLQGYMMPLDCGAEKALCTAAPRLSLLESLDVTYFGGTFSAEIIQTLGRCCPRLTSLDIPIATDEVAKTLARSFPQLRHLRPDHAEKLTDMGVEALLDGCPHLKSLDLTDCSHVRFDDTLAIRCAQQIKHLRRPHHLCLPEYEFDQSFEETREEVEEGKDIYDINYITDSTEEEEEEEER